MPRVGDPAEIDPTVTAVVDRIMARTRENLYLGRPLDHGADPARTCRELGIEMDGRTRGPRGFVPTLRRD